MEKILTQYFAKEEGLETVTTDYGFFAYNYDEKNKNFMIAHFHVDEEQRGKKSYELFRIARLRAKSLGAARLVGNLFLNAANSEDYTKKLLIHLKHGYKVAGVFDNCVTVMKEI